MAQVDEKLLQQCREKPNQKVAVVLTVDDRFDPSKVKGFRLKEIQANLLYSGTLPCQVIIMLSEQEGVVAIEPDFDVSVT